MTVQETEQLVAKLIAESKDGGQPNDDDMARLIGAVAINLARTAEACEWIEHHLREAAQERAGQAGG